MKTSENTFELNTVLEVILDSNDNDGLIFVPKNTEIKVVIENYFGKILINEINIKNVEDEMALSKDKLETSLPLLDLKLLDRYLFKQLNDKTSFNYSPYTTFQIMISLYLKKEEELVKLTGLCFHHCIFFHVMCYQNQLK